MRSAGVAVQVGFVADAGDAEDAGAAMAGDDDFGDCGHANGIGADGAQEAQVGGAFKGGAAEPGVDAFAQFYPGFGRGLAGEVAELAVVGLAHIGEARAEFVKVGADEGVEAHHADQVKVVGDEHQVAGGVGGVDGAGGVGDDEGLDAEALHDADGQGDLGHGVAFVEVDAALHDEHGLVFEAADDELAGVAGDGGFGPVRQVAEGDAVGVADGVGKPAQAGAKDKGDRGLVGCARAYGAGDFVDLFQG